MNGKFRLRNKKWLFLPVIALATFLLTLFGNAIPAFIETFYSEGIYPFIASVLSFFSSLFPFSLDDVFYIFLIISLPAIIVLIFTKKISIKKAGKLILNILSLIFILFYWLWGFNYFRNNVNTRLQIPETRPDEKEFTEVLKQIISETNANYTGFTSFTKQQADSLTEDTYKKLAPQLGIDYPGGKRRPKNITFSRFFAGAGISGYFGPFFNEVHVNSYIPEVQYPVVLAHEKAHQFGITSEAEANFYAWLVCSQSNSKELKYSAGLFILRYFLSQARLLKNYPELVALINKDVKTDFIKVEEHWDKLRNEKVDHAASKVNDAYLKSNRVEKGVEDYTGVVQFIMDYYSDKNATSKPEH